MPQYELKTMKLADLKPHPKNPRVHPADMLKKLMASIREFGFTNPVLLSEDNMILAGHARCKAAEQLGMTEVPCIVLPLKGSSADAYVIADNKLNELSEWDENKLAELFADLDSAGFDAELTGFDIDEIDALLSPKGCVEDNFDEEKAKKEVEDNGGAVTRSSDIWLLGEHRLLCADSTLPETFEKLLEGEKAQLCVTSPPYAVGKKKYETDSIDDWFATMRPAIKNICRHAETVCYNIGDKMNTGGQWIEPTFAYSVQMFADNGFRPLFVKVWNKQRMALSSSAPIHLSTLKGVGDSEYIAAFAGNEQTASGENDEYDLSEISFVTAFGNYNYKLVRRLSKQERREFGYSAIWNFPSVGGVKNTKNRLDERNHKARFPVTLPWRCIKMFTDNGNIVLEPFSGTFSTGIACEQLGRRCFAVERDETYTDISVARFHAFAPDAEIYLLRDGEKIPFADTGVMV